MDQRGDKEGDSPHKVTDLNRHILSNISPPQRSRCAHGEFPYQAQALIAPLSPDVSDLDVDTRRKCLHMGGVVEYVSNLCLPVPELVGGVALNATCVESSDTNLQSKMSMVAGLWLI